MLGILPTTSPPIWVTGAETNHGFQTACLRLTKRLSSTTTQTHPAPCQMRVAFLSHHPLNVAAGDYTGGPRAWRSAWLLAGFCFVTYVLPIWSS